MLAKFYSNLLSLPERIKLMHILIPGIVMVGINMLVNLLFAEGELLNIFNTVFELTLSGSVTFLLFLIYSVSKKKNYAFSHTLLW